MAKIVCAFLLMLAIAFVTQDAYVSEVILFLYIILHLRYFFVSFYDSTPPPPSKKKNLHSSHTHMQNKVLFVLRDHFLHLFSIFNFNLLLQTYYLQIVFIVFYINLSCFPIPWIPTDILSDFFSSSSLNKKSTQAGGEESLTPQGRNSSKYNFSFWKLFCWVIN